MVLHKMLPWPKPGGRIPLQDILKPSLRAALAEAKTTSNDAMAELERAGLARIVQKHFAECTTLGGQVRHDLHEVIVDYTPKLSTGPTDRNVEFYRRVREKIAADCQAQKELERHQAEP